MTAAAQHTPPISPNVLAAFRKLEGASAAFWRCLASATPAKTTLDAHAELDAARHAVVAAVLADAVAGRQFAKPTPAPDYAADVERLCEHAVRAAQANAIRISAKDTPGEERAIANLLAAERALAHAKRELATTLEQLRDLAGEACQ